MRKLSLWMAGAARIAIGIGLFLTAAPHADSSDKAPAKPNVIVVLIDDLGHSDVGAYGAKDISTPHIDSLARNGARFTNGYATCPVCTPSRAALLTGRYQQRTGLEWVISPDPILGTTKYGLDEHEKTIADLLKEQGYATAAIGKWHLGDQQKYFPTRRGFDYFFGYLQWGHYFLNPSKEELADSSDPWIHYISSIMGKQANKYLTDLANAPIYRNDKVVGFDGYLTDVLNREALEFIEKNHDRPFFLYLAHAAQHVPVQATEKYLSRYPNLSNDKFRKNYAAALSAVDDGVGDILAKLQELKLDKNTAIIFTSDNGGPSFWEPRPEILEFIAAGTSFTANEEGVPPDFRAESKHFQWTIGANGSDNTPLSFGKGILYEGGIRVPYIVYWPGVVPAGTISNDLVSHLDILPTFVAAAGGQLPADRQYDGIDIRPLLEGKGLQSERALYWRVWRDRAVRDGNWKLVWSGDAKGHLYDLDNDIEEKTDLAGSNPDVVKKLQDKWTAWNKGNVDPLFTQQHKIPSPKNGKQ